MGAAIRTRPVVPEDVLDELESGLSIGSLSTGVGDVFERIWHLFISMRTGLFLILVLAFLALVGTVLTQAPAGMRADPAAYAAWLDQVRPKYGGWTGIFDVLGFFSVFSSIWFKGTVVLLSTSILACSVNRAPRLWRQAMHPRTVVSPQLFDHAALAATIDAEASPHEAADEVVRQLKARHFRTVLTPDEGGFAVYADRYRWGPFGTVIAHLSLIVVLAGAILGTTGFRTTDFAVTIGSTADVGNGTNLSVKASSFTDSYYENGTPADYASHIVLYAGGQQVAERTIHVNDPLRYEDLSIYQSFYGPAADVRVRDSSGTSLFDKGVPLLWDSTDGTKAIGQFQLADRGLTVYVIGPASGKVDPQIRPGQVQVEVYQDPNTETPLGLQIVNQGQAATVAGLEFTFVRERQFTGLIVARDPGAPVVWAGIGFLVFGVVLVLLFPVRRVWGRVRSGRSGAVVQIAALARHDVSFFSTFQGLVDSTSTALEGSSGT